MFIDAANVTKSVLNTSTALTAYFTGGIVTINDLRGANALLERQSAFDSNLVIKPAIVIKARDALATNQINDEDAQQVSVVQVVEIHFIFSRAESMVTIDNHGKTVFKLLHGRQHGGYFFHLRQSYAGLNDRELGHARHLISEYETNTIYE